MSEKPVILFESYPDFNGSALAVYEELVRRGYDKKYDLVWAVYDNFNFPTDKKIIKLFSSNGFCRLNPANAGILKRTKVIVDSNRYIYKAQANGAFRFHVRHGCCLKNSKAYNQNIGMVDGILTTSEQMLVLDKQIFPQNISNKFIITGMPSNDKIFHPKNLYAGLIQELTGTNEKFNKIIGWLPTFREHRLAHYGKNRFQFGLPALHSLDEYNKLNDTLKKNNELLIIQMHHAQAKNYQQLPKASNIVFVNEAIKNKYGIATTDILGNCDALLTDYSSVYHEYLILNRPIGLCIEDLPQYAKTNGFFCNYLDWIKGDYLLDNTDLCSWVNDIALGKDNSKAEREISLNKIHEYKDDKATERVVNYIIEKAKL